MKAVPTLMMEVEIPIWASDIYLPRKNIHIENEIGSGSFGVVYKAKAVDLGATSGKPVVGKQLFDI